MNNAYSALSKVYEYLICDCDYEKWSDYLISELNKLNVSGTVLDLACGSGFFTRAIKRAGFDVLGIDVSEEMLSEAVRITDQANLSIQYILMDMLKLKLIKRVDCITIVNDAVNYVPKTKLKTLFTAIRSALKKGGVLAFDFSSEYKLRNIIANNLFGEDDRDCSYLWFNKLFDDHVQMDISLFIKDGLGYTKREESHIQYIHSKDDVLALLSHLDFEVIRVTGHMGETLDDKSERIQIFARRK